MPTLTAISRHLSDQVDALSFSAPAAFVYNPLTYARAPHEQFLSRFGEGKPAGRVLLVGMNPGPFGMMQTGVPFGAVGVVRDWLGIDHGVTPPATQHPKRPIEGFATTREEVSGARLWGWAQQTFGTPDAFFERFFVHNCIPLAFLNERGANVTPDKLAATELNPLLAVCDAALREVVAAIQPRMVVGVGAFAEARAAAAVAGTGVPVGRILHPSPASPAANRGWAPQATAQLQALGVL